MRIPSSSLVGAAFVGLVLATSPAAQGPPGIDPLSGIPMVVVGEPGNAADTSGSGAVALPFRVGIHEVTNAEYVELLNAVAADDPNGLYATIMTDSDRGGILRAGAPGAYTYSTKPDFDDKPANGFSWLDAARFCNWLHNGKPGGPQGPATTEDGAYDLSLPPAEVVRKPGALFFLPDADEWYKAAYHDPFDPAADAGGTPDYWLYPTRSDALPALATADPAGDVTNPGPNVANTDKGADWNGENGNVTTVGGCQSASAWGALDLGGNVNEMTETLGTPIPPNPPSQPDPLPTRRIRGGDFSNTGVLMGSPPSLSGSLNMLAEATNIGCRVASFAPWTDVGGGLAGTGGVPTLGGTGVTVGGQPVSFDVAGALPGSAAALILGFARIDAPFAGGTLVPSVDILILGLPIGPAGTLVLPSTWVPGLPPQLQLFAQVWVIDPGGPQGLAATNGLLITTP